MPEFTELSDSVVTQDCASCDYLKQEISRYRELLDLTNRNLTEEHRRRMRYERLLERYDPDWWRLIC